MPKVNVLEDSKEELSYSFFCPGCGCSHFFRVRSGRFTRMTPNRPADIPLWHWNHEPNRPTVSPSIHVFPNDPSKTCHLFIENGKIRYLSDSYHHLKGQLVEMEEDD